MSKQKSKYYVVWRGRLTGIFNSWEECRTQIEGYEGAQYKGYPTLELAEAAHKLNYWQAIKQGVGSREQGTGSKEQGFSTLNFIAKGSKTFGSQLSTCTHSAPHYQSLLSPFARQICLLRSGVARTMAQSTNI